MRRRERAERLAQTATTSPITTSAGVGAAAAATPIEPSGATTTSSSSVVPRETTAAGVEAGLPSLDQPLRKPPDDGAAHERDERPGDLRERARVELLDVVRCERGDHLRDAAMRDGDAGRLGHRSDRRDAGHELERHAGPHERERFLAAASEDERVAALQPHDAAAALAVRDEQLR